MLCTCASATRRPSSSVRLASSSACSWSLCAWILSVSVFRLDSCTGRQGEIRLKGDLWALYVGSTQTEEVDFASPSKISGDGDGRKRETKKRERKTLSVRKLHQSEILTHSASQQSTHRSPPSWCPAALSSGRSQCGDAPRSAPPAGQTMTARANKQSINPSTARISS